jgi:hypothetical protein
MIQDYTLRSRWADGLRQIENAPANIPRIEARSFGSAAFIRAPLGPKALFIRSTPYSPSSAGSFFRTRTSTSLKTRKTAVS